MKYVISTTGSEIKFNLTAARKLVIETKIPIEVTDEEFIILDKRLGAQIKSISMTSTAKATGTPSVTPSLSKPSVAFPPEKLEQTIMSVDETGEEEDI